MTISQRTQSLLLVAFFQFSLQAQVNVFQGNTLIDTFSNNSKIVTGYSDAKIGDKAFFSNKIEFTGLSFTNELSVFDFLQGRISGLDIISASGNPGRNGQAIIRGQNIFGKNSPLIIIDGLQMNSIDELFNNHIYYGEDIRSMIPVSLEDISSVEILKDASATSLYGAEGANGVILIETKKGSIRKIGVSYQFNQSIIKEPSYRPMLTGDEYIMYQLEAIHNAEGVFDVPPEISYDRDYPGFYNYSSNTDWIKEVTQTGFASNHQLNIFGGNEKNRYYGSTNYLSQKGTIINTGYNRFMGRLNFEHYFTKKLTLALNLNYANSKYDGNVAPNGINILEMAFKKAPNMSVWEHDAQGNETGRYFAPFDNYQGNSMNFYNPVGVSESGSSSITLNNLMTTVHLQYDFKDWLIFRESFSYDRSAAVSNSFLPVTAILSDGNGQDFERRNEFQHEEYRNELQTRVKIPFKNEYINMLKGTFTWIMQDENINFLIDAGHLNLHGNFPEKTFNAAVSSVYYRLLDRYILNINTRFESREKKPWDPHYGSDNEKAWDHQYGISMGWRLPGEPFMKNLRVLDKNSMIHAGWSFSEYPGDDYNLDIYSPRDYQTRAFDFGIGLGLFNNRMRLTTDYYNKITTENLYNNFFERPELKLQNKGWECAVGYDIIRKKDLAWSIQFNTAHNNQLYLEIPFYGVGELSNGNYVSHPMENKSPGLIYGLVYDGVYATDQDVVARDKDGNILQDDLGIPVMLSFNSGNQNYPFQGGDAKYRDINYDGIIDENDLVYLGNSNPKFTGGFGSMIRYKNLSLTCNFHYRAGYNVINQVDLNSEGLFSKNNQNKNELNRWRVQGQQTPDIMPRACTNNNVNNLGSSKYVENGGFIKMNYINLSYQFTPVFCQKLHIQDLVLSLSSQRTFTFTNYSGLDPETETGNNSFSLNKDNIRVYPPSIYTISIRITI